MNTCAEPGCLVDIGNTQYRIATSSYCKPHYHKNLWVQCWLVYNEWQPNNEIPPELRRTVGELVFGSELKLNGAPLEKRHLKDNGYNFVKTPNGFTFEVVRHPGAWTNEIGMTRKTQAWNIDLNNKTATLLTERNTMPQDTDSEY